MRYPVSIAILVLLVSCDSGTKRPAAPKDLIPHDTMVLVMHDIMRMESYIETRYQRLDKYFKAGKNSGRKILSGYRISPARFDASYKWYVANETELQAIYQEVIEKMNKEAAELSAKGVKPSDPLPLQDQPIMGNPLQGR